MNFSEKLIFLMNLVSINSAELARALHVDPSQISRMRSGLRALPQKSNMAKIMASFFASKCVSDYQYAALSELLGYARLRETADCDELTRLLTDWLTDDSRTASSATERFFLSLDHVAANEQLPAATTTSAGNAPVQSDNILAFYGNEGRRNAVRELLSRVAQLREPCTILISSDESLNWLMEDAAFFQQTKRDFLALAQAGVQIQRIMPPLLNSNEVFDSFHLWLPLYLTGNVKPYYLLKLRDGIYQRTLIVVPGVVALVSASIVGQSKCGVTYILSAPVIVDNYAQEFAAYRAMCRPALDIYDPAADSERLSARILTYFNDPSASIRKSNGLSFISIPRPRKRILQKSAVSAFLRMLCQQVVNGKVLDEQAFFSSPITDIMRLALPQEIKAKEISYCLDEDTIYTPAEYRAHLLGIVALLERHDQYNVVLTDRFPMSCVIYAKRDVGALLFMTQAPYKVIDIIAPATFQGVWEYLDHATKTGLSSMSNKERVLSELRGLIAQLDDAS